MKKLFLILMLAFMPMFCIGLGLTVKSAPLTVYAESEVVEQNTEEEVVVETSEETIQDNKSEMEIYFEEKILPILISIATALGTIVITYYPQYQKIRKGALMFGKAKDGLEESNASNKKTIKQLLAALEEQNKTLAAVKEELLDMKNQTKAEIIECEKHCKNMIEIAKIGFGNTTELVKNGYASAIQKVGENEEESEEN